MTSDLTFITNEKGESLLNRFSALIKETRCFDCLVGYFYKLHEKEVLPTIEEIRTPEHRILDQIVFDFLGLNMNHQQYIMKKLEDVITRRESKASS